MPKRGYKQTEKHKNKKRGIKLSEEHKDKLRQAKLKNPVKYWLGKKRPNISLIMRGRKLTDEHKKKLSISHLGQISWNKGKKMPEKSRVKLSSSLKGRKLSKEHREKISKALKGKIGKNACGWKGGLTSKHNKLRNSCAIELRLWREAVLARDNWICQKCKVKNYRLCSHHIQNFIQFSELRFAIDNGITFCKNCHKLFHKKYGRRNNTKEQIKDFLK